MFNIQSYHLYEPDADHGRVSCNAHKLDSAVRLSCLPLDLAPEDANSYIFELARRHYHGIVGGCLYLDFFDEDLDRQPGVGRLSFSKKENMFGIPIRFDTVTWKDRSFDDLRHDAARQIEEAFDKIVKWLKKRKELKDEPGFIQEFVGWMHRLKYLQIDKPAPVQQPPFDKTFEVHQLARAEWRRNVIAKTKEYMRQHGTDD